MIDKEELKSIVILSYLTDRMLDKLIPVIDILHFQENEIIFSEGEQAKRFYMLKMGKVLLEQKLSDNITVSMGSIKPGFSFGWSAMLGEERYTSDALCSESSQIFSIKSEKMLKMLDADPEMGYIVNQRLLRIVKKRLDHRTNQFLRLIRSHPDIKSIL